ncbi:hypothetical protein HRbin33_02143 [bacterium HR33]|nr:hypothetical protein HRbin33_02143 [bacterium HR33]
MDLDSLIQLIVLLGAGLAWLLGGGRKQQPGDRSQPGPVRRSGTGTRPAPQRAERRAGTPTTMERTGDQVQARRRPEPATARRQATLEDLYRILTGEPVGRPVLQEAPPPPADIQPRDMEARPLEQIPEVEARSLETLEPAGGTSHERFHELYVGAIQPPRQPLRRPRLRLRPASAREGILWREVLGPPKGLR